MAEKRGKMGAFRCPRCGEITSGGLKSCPQCGQRLAIECPDCRETWRHIHGYKFCPNCGKRISDPAGGGR